MVVLRGGWQGFPSWTQEAAKEMGGKCIWNGIVTCAQEAGRGRGYKRSLEAGLGWPSWVTLSLHAFTPFFFFFLRP